MTLDAGGQTSAWERCTHWLTRGSTGSCLVCFPPHCETAVMLARSPLVVGQTAPASRFCNLSVPVLEGKLTTQ